MKRFSAESALSYVEHEELSATVTAVGSTAARPTKHNWMGAVSAEWKGLADLMGSYARIGQTEQSYVKLIAPLLSRSNFARILAETPEYKKATNAGKKTQLGEQLGSDIATASGVASDKPVSVDLAEDLTIAKWAKTLAEEEGFKAAPLELRRMRKALALTQDAVDEEGVFMNLKNWKEFALQVFDIIVLFNAMELGKKSDEDIFNQLLAALDERYTEE